jgi:UDP-N-acetylmuramoyl-L-alanyl-D-glutamate--2,6-diaminopimelate ligase
MLTAGFALFCYRRRVSIEQSSPSVPSEAGMGVAQPAANRPQNVVARSLADIADQVGASLVAGDAFVTGIALSAASTQPGDLFFAQPARTHGARYLADAVEAGAVAVLTDAAGADIIDATTGLSALPRIVVDGHPVGCWVGSPPGSTTSLRVR